MQKLESSSRGEGCKEGWPKSAKGRRTKGAPHDHEERSAGLLSVPGFRNTQSPRSDLNRKFVTSLENMLAQLQEVDSTQKRWKWALLGGRGRYGIKGSYPANIPQTRNSSQYPEHLPCAPLSPLTRGPIPRSCPGFLVSTWGLSTPPHSLSLSSLRRHQEQWTLWSALRDLGDSGVWDHFSGGRN